MLVSKPSVVLLVDAQNRPVWGRRLALQVPVPEHDCKAYVLHFIVILIYSSICVILSKMCVIMVINIVVAGRPADVLPMPDGSVLVSDDLNGALYRITYSQAMANVATVNATADNANFTDRVLPELQLAPAPDVSEMVPSLVAATQTAG